MCLTRPFWGEAAALWEETSKCTTETSRGKGPSAHARIAEITSGRAMIQQGLVATCKDSNGIGKTEAFERRMVWHMSPYERRRRGKALRGDPGGHPRRGNASKGRRGSRHLAGTIMTPGRGIDRGQPGQGSSRVEPLGKRRMSGVCADQRLSLGTRRKAQWGQARVANRTREIRPSGMKTGASGNVAKGAGLRPMAKAMDKPPDPKARAPEIYPD